jgi:hypothetical protein
VGNPKSGTRTDTNANEEKKAIQQPISAFYHLSLQSDKKEHVYQATKSKVPNNAFKK